MTEGQPPWDDKEVTRKRKRRCPICHAQPGERCWSRTKPLAEGYEHKSR